MASLSREPNWALGENVTGSFDRGLPNWSVTNTVTVAELFTETDAGADTETNAGGPGVWVNDAVTGVRPASVAVIVTRPAVVEAWIVAL